MLPSSSVRLRLRVAVLVIVCTVCRRAAGTAPDAVVAVLRSSAKVADVRPAADSRSPVMSRPSPSPSPSLRFVSIKLGCVGEQWSPHFFHFSFASLPLSNSLLGQTAEIAHDDTDNGELLLVR